MVGTARQKKWVGIKQRGRWGGGGEVGREGEVKSRTETKHHGIAFTRHEENIEGGGKGGGREGEVKSTTDTEHNAMAFTRHENNKNRSL